MHSSKAGTSESHSQGGPNPSGGSTPIQDTKTTVPRKGNGHEPPQSSQRKLVPGSGGKTTSSWPVLASPRGRVPRNHSLIHSFIHSFIQPRSGAPVLCRDPVRCRGRGAKAGRDGLAPSLPSLRGTSPAIQRGPSPIPPNLEWGWGRRKSSYSPRPSKCGALGLPLS